MPESTKMALTSADLNQERLEALRQLVPETFGENGLDWARLRTTLGALVDDGRERYGLSWPGKGEAMRVVQVSSTGTLLPRRADSVAFDQSENVFIEGDNLEVLKLLQKSYHGKIKMIYIDPPYNTGKEFIYPDNFREGLQDYLRYSGQMDGEGIKLSTNTETSGRYHSKWLSMMYPRLFLARNLLKDDGVIFVSIDDHEVHNLRHLMDEIFGPENFVATVIWHKVYVPKNSARHFSDDHDYILVYARSADAWTPELLPRTAEQDAKYTNPDGDTRGPWRPGPMAARNYYSKGLYKITCPSGRVIDGPPPGSYWRFSEEKFRDMDRDGRIYWGPGGDNSPATKLFLSEVMAGRVPQTIWSYNEVGHTQEAKKELLERVSFSSSDSVFDTPKPTRLIEQMLRIGTRSDEGDIVLDFFAGSGTTGEAVWKLNQQDGGNRRFILVQLPERTGYDDYPTIADISRTRLRNAAGSLSDGAKSKLDFKGDASQDRGFRAYQLAGSCFREWAEGRGRDLERQLRLHVDHLLPGRDDEAVLWEIALKAGIELSSRVEMQELHDARVHAFHDGLLLICLADPISQDQLRAIAARKPVMVVCLDRAFKNNDQLLTNTVLEMRSHGVQHFRTV